MNEDAQHLRLLVIGHYVAAALTALLACIPLIHLTVGLMFLFNPPPPPPDGGPFPAEAIGVVFALIGGAFVLGGWAFATCIFVAGRSLAARKRYYFCLVMAALCCAFFPVGTALGVFSLMVLLRPSVKEMFLQQVAIIPRPGDWRDESFVGRNNG